MDQFQQKESNNAVPPAAGRDGAASVPETPLTQAEVNGSLWRAWAALAPGGTGFVYLPSLESDSPEKK